MLLLNLRRREDYHFLNSVITCRIEEIFGLKEEEEVQKNGETEIGHEAVINYHASFFFWDSMKNNDT